MNALFALTALALSASAQAQPQNIQCYSTGVADAGYLFEISPDRTSAVLEEQSFVGPRPLAEMVCERVPMKPMPDAIENTLICHAKKAGSTLIVRLYEGGFVFQRTAELTQSVVHRDGVKEFPVQFGGMTCNRD